jgi:hypothetical protein
VTQRLNCFASGLRDKRIVLYRPLSLMIVISCLPPGVSIVSTPYKTSSYLCCLIVGEQFHKRPKLYASAFYREKDVMMAISL